MVNDSRRSFFIGIAVGLLFSIPISAVGAFVLFFLVQGFLAPMDVSDRSDASDRSDVSDRSVTPAPEPAPRRSSVYRGKGPFLDQAAPVFSTSTLSGEAWRLEDYRGQIVVLDFWASWCQPCIKEIPRLREIYRRYRYRPDFKMVGVSVDRKKQDLLNAVRKHRVEWPQLFEDGKGWSNEVARLYKVRAIPHVVVIDRDGVVRAYPRGRHLEAQLAHLMDTPEGGEWRPVRLSERDATESARPRYVPRSEKARVAPPSPRTPSTYTLKGALRYRGKPLSRWTDLEPELHLRAGRKHWHEAELEYDAEGGTFEIHNAPRRGEVLFMVSDRGRWGTLPGSYRATVSYDVSRSADLDVDLERVLRVVEPWDSADTSRHSAEDWLRFESPVRFEWDELEGATHYRVQVVASRDAAHAEEYGYFKTALDKKTAETSLTATLPALEPLEHYEFTIFAYDGDERIAHYVSTYSNTFSLTQPFKIASR